MTLNDPSSIYFLWYLIMIWISFKILDSTIPWKSLYYFSSSFDLFCPVMSISTNRGNEPKKSIFLHTSDKLFLASMIWWALWIYSEITLYVTVLTLSVELYSDAGVITDIKIWVFFYYVGAPAGSGVILTGTFQFHIVKIRKNS